MRCGRAGTGRKDQVARESWGSARAADSIDSGVTHGRRRARQLGCPIFSCFSHGSLGEEEGKDRAGGCSKSTLDAGAGLEPVLKGEQSMGMGPAAAGSSSSIHLVPRQNHPLAPTHQLTSTRPCASTKTWETHGLHAGSPLACPMASCIPDLLVPSSAELLHTSYSVGKSNGTRGASRRAWRAAPLAPPFRRLQTTSFSSLSTRRLDFSLAAGGPRAFACSGTCHKASGPVEQASQTRCSHEPIRGPS